MGGVIKVNVRCANRGLGVIAISSARPPLRRSRGIRIKFEGIRSITKKNMIGQQASVVFLFCQVYCASAAVAKRYRTWWTRCVCAEGPTNVCDAIQ